MTSGTTILMAVRNGATHLPAQLASIAAQSDTDWRLLASDDGSTDHSRDILQAFAAGQPQGKVQILSGPCHGATANFRHLIRQTLPMAHHLAFSDQDDVWTRDHLARARQQIAATGRELVLYGTRLQYCDAQLGHLGHSPLPRRAANFRNALIQNMFSGNTMVLSPAAAQLLQTAEREVSDSGRGILLHDWWSYQLLSGCGAALVYDPEVSVQYRQHSRNLVGANRGALALRRRIGRYFCGDYQRWNRLSRDSLSASAHRFTPENHAVYQNFSAALDARLLRRLHLLYRAGLYHQSLGARSAFWLSAMVGRV